MPFRQLQDLLDAYRRTIGAPYGGWETADVLKLFDQFARTPQTWQRELCDATGVNSSKVNRFIDVTEEQGWIERPRSRTPDAKKPLELTAAGRQVIAEFKRLCREAAGKNRRSASRHTAGQRAGKKSGRGPVAGSRSENLWEVLGDVLNPGVDESNADGGPHLHGDEGGDGERAGRRSTRTRKSARPRQGGRTLPDPVKDAEQSGSPEIDDMPWE